MSRRRNDIRSKLVAQGLPAGDEVVEAIVNDLEIVAGVYEPPSKSTWDRRKAESLHAALLRAEALCTALAIGEEKELEGLRRLQLRTELALGQERREGPEIEPWIAPACGCFLETYQSITADRRAPASWREDAQPVLFLAACCELVDPEVTPGRVLRAMQAADSAGELDMTQDAELARARAYEAWGHSDVGRKFFELRRPF
jgi:hypothetical protein